MDDNYKHPADEKKVRFKLNLVGSKNYKWVLIITLTSFFLSATLSFLSSNLLQGINTILAFCVVLAIILIGIAFDVIGIAVTAADETPFHAMASRKYYGAKQSIKLIRNANKVSSFCNDVVGDICGVISGTASAYIVLRITQNVGALYGTIIGLVISGLVAAMTIGGKAVGKTLAIENSNYIVYKVGVILMFFIGRINVGKRRKR